MTTQSLNPEDFQNEICDDATILIDVRTPEEKGKFGYIQGTDLFLDMHNDGFFEDILKLDRKKKYLTYCWHANRTGYLINFMKNAGFEYVKDLSGGTENWEKTGFQLIKA
ncbi:rhodanese-like domain-containing protein [Candidatus Gracilibacteria bacterium 28_42_T64]|nr:rhodanese-like domain-containing protein [Candidatus Gracilibacteria bacterium 28_42_T64]